MVIVMQVKLMNKYKFVKIILDKSFKSFILYIKILKTLVKIIIYLF